MRLSIKPHNRQYILKLAEYLNCPPSEAINYLLLKIKSEGLLKEPITEDKFQKIGFDFNEDILISLDEDDFKTPSEKIDDFYQSQQSQSHLQEQTDPLIARLLSAGLEGF
jgi:hypothetical protein